MLDKIICVGCGSVLLESDTTLLTCWTRLAVWDVAPSCWRVIPHSLHVGQDCSVGCGSVLLESDTTLLTCWTRLSVWGVAPSCWRVMPDSLHVGQDYLCGMWLCLVGE